MHWVMMPRPSHASQTGTPMLRRFLPIVLLAGVLSGTCVPALWAQSLTATPQRTLIMGTGGVTGFYYPVGGAVCRVANALRQRTGLRCLVESTAGSLQNLNGLRTGDLDMAVVQSGWVSQAVKGVGAFAVEGPGRDLRALMVLHGEPLTLLVRKDGGISSVADLKRRKVNLGRKGTAQRQLTEALFDAMGWTPADFPQAVDYESDEQIEALCSGKIDMAAYVIAHPISVIQEALSRCNAKLLEIDAKIVAKLLADNPHLSGMSIPAGLYDSQPKPVPTFGMKAMLLTSTRLPSEVAEAIVSGVIDNFDRFQNLHPAIAHVSREELSASEPLVPLHEGAKKVYRERRLLKR